MRHERAKPIYCLNVLTLINIDKYEIVKKNKYPDNENILTGD